MDIQLNLKRLPPPNNIWVTNPKGHGQLVITWDMIRNPDQNNITGEIIKIMYNVYRGNSANGIFYKQNNVFIESNRYEDNNVGKNPNTEYWYKVSTVYQHKSGKFIEGPISSAVVYHVLNNNKWFNKINERNYWILKNTGELFDLYTYKTEGEHCPQCWDVLRGRSVNDSCSICLGTGIVGGYEPLFQLYLRQKPANSELAITSEGLVQNNNPGAWTISKTIIKNRDILINPRGTMFSVLTSQVNHAAGYLFHQEIQMKELDPTDSKYNLLKRVSLSLEQI